MELDLGFTPGNSIVEVTKASVSYYPEDAIKSITVEFAAKRDDTKWAKAHGVQAYSEEMMAQPWFPKNWYGVRITLK